MSFKYDNLTPFANTTKLGVKPALWLYHNADADTVTTAGFIPVDAGVKAGDYIIVTLSSGNVAPKIYRASVSDETVSLTACTTPYGS